MNSGQSSLKGASSEAQVIAQICLSSRGQECVETRILITKQSNLHSPGSMKSEDTHFVALCKDPMRG